MSELDALLARLAALGITVEVAGGALRVIGPRARLDEALLSELRAAKPALLARARARARPDPCSTLIPSSAVRRLYALHRLDPRSLAYQLVDVFEVRGAVDPERLDQALRALIARHEALRSRFVMTADGLRQEILAAVEFELERVATDELPAPEPFDVAVAPLVRARWLMPSAGPARLMLELHHLICDGGSRELLLAELARLYAGAPVPVIRRSLAEYVARERARLDGPEGEALASAWAEVLADPPPALELPGDHPRPRAVTFEGDRVGLALEPELVAALRAAASRRRCSLATVLLAAYALTLSRFAASPEFLVGLVVSGRDDETWAGLVGMLVNTVPLRLRVDPRATLAAWLAGVRDTVADAIERSAYPLEAIVRRVGGSRDPSRNPLFDVLFSFAVSRPSALELGDGAALVETGFDPPVSMFDLSLFVEDWGEALHCSLEFATRIFSRATIERFAEHLRGACRALAGADHVRVGELATVPAPERERLLELGRGPIRAYPADDLASALRARMIASADAPAIIDADGRALSYARLCERVEQLAARLRAAGVERGQIVAVLTPRSPALVVAVLAPLWLGAAFMPIALDTPPRRMRALLERSGATVLVTAGGVEPPERDGLTTIDLDRLEPGPRVSPVALEPEALAYLLFTSGSTGAPKGVRISHAAVLNRLRWGLEALAITPADAFLLKTSYTFDVALAELFSPLLVGARLVLAREGGAADVDGLIAQITREGVSIVHFVPSMLAPFVRALGPGHGPLGRLRAVLCSGEALGPDHARALFETLGEAIELHNLYGPTEAAIEVVHERVRPGDPVVAIGRPIANVRVHVLDDAGRPAPLGAVGELGLAGVQLALGYHEQPDETAARFVAAPAVGEDRIYRTGDFVRWDRGGRLLFLGRRDGQIKLRGRRIELAEIRATLAAHPKVALVEVGAIRDDRRGPTLVAAVVARGALELDELRAWAAESLPGSMIPRAIALFDDRIPRLSSAKIDWAAIARVARIGDAHEPELPDDPLVRELAEIWAAVLGERPRSGEADFFADGGHSLLALELVHELRRRFGVAVPLRGFLDRPTLAALGEWIARARAGVLSGPALAGLDRPEPIAAPLSLAQERLWFLWRMEPSSTAYALPYALWIDGPVDEAALARAIVGLGERHSVLRTRFEERGGEVLAIADLRLEPPTTEPCPTDEAPRAWARRRLETLAAAPFDLTRGPLIRATILRLSDERRALSLCLHHVVADGWSLNVLLRELEARYRALRAGTEPNLPPALPHATWALAEREALTPARLELLTAGWRELLGAELEDLRLPPERPGRPRPRGRGSAIPVVIPAPVVAALRALGRELSTTLFTIVLAGFRLALARHARQRRFAIGVPWARRDHHELADAVGLFLNLLAIPGEHRPSASWREACGAERRALERALELGELPFDALVRALGQTRRDGVHPLVQAFFDLQPAGAPIVLEGARSVRLEELGGDALKFDVQLSLEDDGGELRGSLTVDEAVLGRAGARALAEHLVTVLEAAAAAPDRSVAELPIVREAELARLSPALVRRPSSPAIHLRVQASARRDGERVAVREPDRTTRYAALERRASTIAAALRGRGLGPGSAVLVYLERGATMIAAMLGILAAGATLVPVDRRNPAPRVRAMAEQIEAALCVADSDALALPCAVATPEELRGDPRDAEPWVAPDPEAPAYVLFTSGSRGRPKGVAIPHRAAASFLDWALATYDRAELDEVLAATAVGFDLAIFELFAPLAAGTTIVLAADGLAAPEHPDYDRVTLINTVPSVVATLLDHARLPRAVQIVNLAGEALAPALVDALYERGVARVHDLYGPTEATTYATAGVRGPGDLASIGRALSNARIHVLDDRRAPLGIGMLGELAIAGDCLALGYVGEPELTARSFVELADGERIYLTGDLGWWLPDGRLAYAGRRDDQLKWHGYRIEPGEIAAVLRELPGVAEAFVAPREGPSGALLCAYWSAGDEGPTVETLREHARARLPPYMIPGAFLQVERLARTDRGKIDPRALAALPLTERETTAPARPPGTELERTIAAIWAEILGRAAIGLDDDFFLLGGHSLAAMRATALLGARLGHALPLRALFEAPSLERYAASLAAATPDEHTERAGGARMAPLSAIQQDLWSGHRRAADPSVFNMVAAVGLRGPLELERLAAAVDELVRAHAILRARIVSIPEVTALVAEAPRAGVLEVIEVSEGRTELELEPIIDRLSRTFEIERGPALRVAVIRRAPARHVLVVVAHHLIGDEWSLDLILRALARRYADPDAPVEAPRFGYLDHARAEHEAIADGRLDASLAWWRRYLARPWPALALPWSGDSPGEQPRLRSFEFELDPGRTRALLERAASARATAFLLTLAVLAEQLARHDPEATELRVATNLARRDRPERAAMLGPLTDTAILRIPLARRASPSERIELARRALVEVSRHAEVPFAHVRAGLDPGSAAADLARIFVIVQMQDSTASWPNPLIEEPITLNRASLIERNVHPYDLAIVIEINQDQLHEGRARLQFVTRVAERHEPLAKAFCEALTAGLSPSTPGGVVDGAAPSK